MMARSAALWTIAALALVWWLRAASALLVPVALAMCISYALEPVVARLTAVMPRIVATALLLVLLLGASGWGLYTLRDEAAAAIGALPRAAHRVRQLIGGEGASGPAASIQQVATELQGGAARGSEDSREPGSGARQSASAPQAPAAATLLARGATSALTLLGNVVTIVFLVFFVLAAGDHFSDRLIEIAGDAEHRTIATGSCET